MPTVTPASPGEWAPFDSEFDHVRAHRALETAVESLDSTGLTSTGTVVTNTMSTVALIATRAGFGGAVPGTASTAAPIKGFYRTAATINVAVPSMSTNSVTSKIFSVESQIGNSIQPGDPVMVLPQSAWPAAVVQGNAYCLDTNSITVWWRSISGINATATVAVHVFAVDLT